MTTIDFITELFCRVDDKITDDKHSQGTLYPSEAECVNKSETVLLSNYPLNLTNFSPVC